MTSAKGCIHAAPPLTCSFHHGPIRFAIEVDGSHFRMGRRPENQ